MRHLNRSATQLGASLLVVFAFVIAGCGGRTRPEEITANQRAVKAAVESKTPPPAWAVTDERAQQVWQDAQRFYQQNGYTLVWSDGKRVRPQMDGLIRAIHAADQEGLNPADYGADELGRIRQSFDASHAADADVRYTYAYLRYASDLTHGTINPESIDPQWHAARRTVDVHAALHRGLSDNRIEDSFQTLAPTAAQYQGLKHQLALARQNGPIYLVYFTAWEENGALQTRPDVYGRDRRHVKAVEQ
jgi:murein L,D-transpeptidase YcbB/YkuD